jgi:hypothetical protein
VQSTDPKCSDAHAILGWWTFSREFKPAYWHLFWRDAQKSRIDLPIDDGRPIDAATKEPVRGYALKSVDVWFTPRRPGTSTLQVFAQHPPKKIEEEDADVETAATDAKPTADTKPAADEKTPAADDKKPKASHADGDDDATEDDDEEVELDLEPWFQVSARHTLDWRKQPLRIPLTGGRERYGAIQLVGDGARFEVTKVVVRYPDWEKRVLQKPWDKIGWMLGRRKYLQQVETVPKGVTQKVAFSQYRVRGHEHGYAYVAHCGAGSTCNEIATTLFKNYHGIGTPRVYCGGTPPEITRWKKPQIRIPTEEEMAAALDTSDDISFDDDEDDDDDLDFGDD